MSMTDPIADMLTRIRNGQTARQPSVQVPASKRKLAIAKVLEKEGYLGSVTAENVDGKDMLTLELKYYQDKPVIERLQRVSRPGSAHLQARRPAAGRPGRFGLRDRVDVARRDDERAGARGRARRRSAVHRALSAPLSN